MTEIKTCARCQHLRRHAIDQFRAYHTCVKTGERTKCNRTCDLWEVWDKRTSRWE